VIPPDLPCPALRISGPAADLSTLEEPVLLALIATEEEFDWRGGFSRDEVSTRAIDDLHLAHEVLREYGLVPTYAIDYPVATQKGGHFKAWLDEGSAEIGAHLHPWVNPPHDESVGLTNSFPGNLSPELEYAKLEALVEAIEAGTGRRPILYQAGRFGIAGATLEHLERLGFLIDASTAPPFDYRNEGGPNFSGLRAVPYWIEGRERMLEIPVTGAYLGGLHRRGPRMFPVISKRPLSKLRVGGVLSRLKLLERSRLTPEGHTLGDMMRLTRGLHQRGQKVFTFYFHSPTITPGCTEYAPDERARDAFVDRCRRYLDFFFGELDGVAMGHSALYELAARNR